MKIQLHRATIALLSLTIAIASCKKSSNNSTTPAAGFTYKVDAGATITADSANAVLYNLSGARYMDVYVYKAGQEVLEFHFAPTTGTKAATNTLGAAALLTYMESPTASYDSQSGSINVTTCDTIANNVVGDFSFVGKQYPYTGTISHSITEGHMVVTKITKM